MNDEGRTSHVIDEKRLDLPLAAYIWRVRKILILITLLLLPSFSVLPRLSL